MHAEGRGEGEAEDRWDPEDLLPHHDEVGSFRLSQTHEVLFALLDQEVPKDGVKELLINKVGALVPTNVWKSHCLDIFWACRWTPTGLQAVRPVVCLTAGVSLPPGCALVCN